MSAMDDLAQAYIRAIEKRESLPAREAAEAAWYPGHRLGTVDDIEAAIIARRAEDAVLLAQPGHREATAA
ncbi:hypothetical protein [Streptacidiphilus cavernicola]|uniref:Uncharacterized protein n=1 Tax=Streptacidiphilus cavernicola TaxID=3342716 RepID=A0ABV6W481_9ACTN